MLPFELIARCYTPGLTRVGSESSAPPPPPPESVAILAQVSDIAAAISGAWVVS